MATDKTGEENAKSESNKSHISVSNQADDATTPIDVLDLEASALSDALEELTRISPEEQKTPRIKDLLASPDSPSRFMTLLSILFALSAVICLMLLVTVYVKNRAAHKKVAPPAEQVVVAPTITEPLGEFRIFLSPEGKERIELRVDVVAECSTQEACTYLKDHLPQARDVVLPALSNSTREEYLAPESKNLIRRKIAERLNSIPMSGKVLQIDFSDMTIE
jgi:flagellar basal body-associated protein FliL